MSVYLCIGLAVLMTVGLLAANSAILQWMNTPEDIFYNTKKNSVYLVVDSQLLFLYVLECFLCDSYPVFNLSYFFWWFRNRMVQKTGVE